MSRGISFRLEETKCEIAEGRSNGKSLGVWAKEVVERELERDAGLTAGEQIITELIARHDDRIGSLADEIASLKQRVESLSTAGTDSVTNRQLFDESARILFLLGKLAAHIVPADARNYIAEAQDGQWGEQLLTYQKRAEAEITQQHKQQRPRRTM